MFRKYVSPFDYVTADLAHSALGSPVTARDIMKFLGKDNPHTQVILKIVVSHSLVSQTCLIVRIV